MASFLSRLFEWKHPMKNYELPRMPPPPILLPPSEELHEFPKRKLYFDNSVDTQTESGISKMKEEEVATEPQNIEYYSFINENKENFGQKIEDPFKRIDFFTPARPEEPEKPKYGFTTNSRTAKTTLLLPKASNSIIKTQVSSSKPYFTFTNDIETESEADSEPTEDQEENTSEERSGTGEKEPVNSSDSHEERNYSSQETTDQSQDSESNGQYSESSSQGYDDDSQSQRSDDSQYYSD